MKKFIKQSNFIIFFLALSLLLISGSYSNISTSLLSTLPNNQNKELLKKFETTSNNKILFVSSKGFDTASLKRIDQLEKAVSNIKNISLYDITSNKKFKEHQKKYQFFLRSLDYKKLQDTNIKEGVKTLYQSLTNSFIPVIINRHDPLNLLKKEKTLPLNFKNGHTILKDYGYLSYFTLQSNNLEEHTEIYHAIKKLTNNDENIKVFSPIFYYVENSTAIKKDVNKILILALLILLTLYIILLKNITLFINTITTLATSSILAVLVVTQMYEEVSIFVIVFGISISSIAIDYMFHHYMHQHYSKQKEINKEVLYGFMTTVLSFFMLSFISFPLIQQISIFALCSLFISYLHFAFLYPIIGFSTKKSLQFNLPSLPIKPYVLFIVSLITLFITIRYIDFDFNIKNLDFDNQSLKKQELFFKQKIKKYQETPILITAKTINQLIVHAKKIKKITPSSYIPFSKLVDSQSFETLNQKKLTSLNHTILEISEEIGFRGSYFKNAYNTSTLSQPNYSLPQLKEYGLNIFTHNNQYYTLFSVNKKDYAAVSNLPFVESLSVKELFEKSLQNIFNELLILGTLIVIGIFLMLFIVTKKRVLYALNFLLFPLALIFIYSYFVTFNILHIFMIFIILAIGIDYAFYTSKSPTIDTKKAIIYSLLSTFAGFGVLVFSSINALYSLGTIAIIGILSIFLLLIFSKRFDYET